MRVEADRSKNWHVLLVYTPTGLLFCGGWTALAVVIAEIPARAALAVWLGGAAIFVAYVAVFCLAWRLTASRVAYVVDGPELQVWRGQRLARSIPVPSVLDFEMLGRMDIRSCLTDVAPPPEWPTGVVTVRKGSTESRIVLPQIMIWGRDERDRAEHALRTALGLAT